MSVGQCETTYYPFTIDPETQLRGTVQDASRVFETFLPINNCIQQFSRSADLTAEPQNIRTPQALDASMRQLIRNCLFEGGGMFVGAGGPVVLLTSSASLTAGSPENATWRSLAGIPLAARFEYAESRCRQVGANFRSNFHSKITPNAFHWIYFIIRLLVSSQASATQNRFEAIKYANVSKKLWFHHLSGCFDALRPTICRGVWKSSYAPIVALMVLHKGFRIADPDRAKTEASGTWCLPETHAGLIYQLEHPATTFNLDMVYQDLPPEAAQYRVVQNSLLLLHALNAGEWFRFCELCISLDLTFFQKSYCFAILTYVRARAIVDTFGKHRPTQKPRLCDKIQVSFLTEKLLFANEEDCRSFLNDLGVPHIDNNSNNSIDNSDDSATSTSATIEMQSASNPDYNNLSPVAMLKRMRDKKCPEDDQFHEFGIYLPHPAFFELEKARRLTRPQNMNINNNQQQQQQQQQQPLLLDVFMLVQQPDATENQKVCNSVEEWTEITRQELSCTENPYDANNDLVLTCRAPSLLGVDVAAQLAEFDRIIENEREKIESKRIHVQAAKLLADFSANVIIPLQEEFSKSLKAAKTLERSSRQDALSKQEKRIAAEKAVDEEEKEMKLKQQRLKRQLMQQESKQEKEEEEKEKEEKMKLQQQEKEEKQKPKSDFMKGFLTSASTSQQNQNQNNKLSASNPFAPSLAGFSSSAKISDEMKQQEQDKEKSKTIISAETSSSALAPPNSAAAAASSTSAKTVTFLAPLSVTTTTEQQQQQQQKLSLAESESQQKEEKEKRHDDDENAAEEDDSLLMPIVKYNPIQGFFYPQSSHFPFLDFEGYSDWAERFIDELRKMWFVFEDRRLNGKFNRNSQINNNKNSYEATLEPSMFFESTTSIDDADMKNYLLMKQKENDERNYCFTSNNNNEIENEKQFPELHRFVVDNKSNNNNNNSYENSYSYQLPILSQKVQWHIAVVSDPQQDTDRSITSTCLSFFYQQHEELEEIFDNVENNNNIDNKKVEAFKKTLLASRNFLGGNCYFDTTTTNNNNSNYSDWSESFKRPIFGLNCINVDATRAKESFASSIAQVIQASENNSNNDISGGIFAIFIEPSTSSNQNNNNNDKNSNNNSRTVLKKWINDCLASLLLKKQKQQQTSSSSSNFMIRGILILADSSSSSNNNDAQDDDSDYYSIFAECWKNYCQEFDRIEGENEMRNQTTEEITSISNEDLLNSFNPASTSSSSASTKILLQQQKRRRQRNQKKEDEQNNNNNAGEQRWNRSREFFFGIDNNSYQNSASTTSSTKTNPKQQQYHHYSHHHQEEPPVVVVPTRNINVRKSFASAISDSLELLAATSRARYALS